MASRTVIDGNAFYEIDEECMRKKKMEEKLREEKKGSKRPDENGTEEEKGRR